MFWEAGNSDVKVIAVMFLDVPDEIDPVDETTFNRLPDVFPSWWVPSESEDIATAMLFSSLSKENMSHPTNEDKRQGRTHRKGYVNFFGLHVCTRQMHTRLETDRPLTKLYHLRCEFGSTSSRMPEDV